MIEPSVSVPMEPGVRLAVTETALPLLEPDAEIFKGPKGLMVCPFHVTVSGGSYTGHVSGKFREIILS